MEYGLTAAAIARTDLREGSRVSLAKLESGAFRGNGPLELVLPGRAGVQPVRAVGPLVEPDLQAVLLRVGAGLDRGGEADRPVGIGPGVGQEQ